MRPRARSSPCGSLSTERGNAAILRGGSEASETNAALFMLVSDALRAADLLERSGLLAERHVRQLLMHRQERVQERGVHLAESLGLGTLARPLEVLIAAGSRRPRDDAIWALARAQLPLVEQATADASAYLAWVDAGTTPS